MLRTQADLVSSLLLVCLSRTARLLAADNAHQAAVNPSMEAETFASLRKTPGLALSARCLARMLHFASVLKMRLWAGLSRTARLLAANNAHQAAVNPSLEAYPFASMRKTPGLALSTRCLAASVLFTSSQYAQYQRLTAD